MSAPAERRGDALFLTGDYAFVQKAWDNTSISLFKECPRKYYLAIIEGWRAKEEAAPLTFGGLLHAALEQFDRARHEGLDREAALIRAVRWTMLETTIRTEGEPIAFYSTIDTRRTRRTLVRSLVWYVEQFGDDAMQTLALPDGRPALELSFRVELPLVRPDGEPYLYSGHLDKVAKLGDNYYIQERKHTVQTLGDYYFEKYSPNSQISGYTFAAQLALHVPISGAIVDAAQVAVSFTRFGRSLAPRTPAQIQEWLNSTLYWIKQAEFCASFKNWPMNEQSCHNFGGCQFRGVCSKDPAVRENFLQGDFIRNPWNPLESR